MEPEINSIPTSILSILIFILVSLRSCVNFNYSRTMPRFYQNHDLTADCGSLQIFRIHHQIASPYEMFYCSQIGLISNDEFEKFVSISTKCDSDVKNIISRNGKKRMSSKNAILTVFVKFAFFELIRFFLF